MNNYKRKRLTIQGFSSKDILPVPAVKESPYSTLSHLFTESDKRVFNTMVWFFNVFRKVSPSQDRIAHLAGISRQQCSRVLGRLQELGLILSNYRHLQTNIYKPSSWLLLPNIRATLSSLISNLAYTPYQHYFSLLALTSGMIYPIKENKSSQSEYVTQEKDYIYKTLVNSNDIGTNKLPNCPDGYSSTSLGLSLNRQSVGKSSRAREGTHAYERKAGAVMEASQKNLTLGMIRSGQKVNPISRAVLDIKELKLSRWGQIKLTGFPDGAIEYARKQFKLCKRDLANPFGYFMKIASSWCKERNIEPDWDWVDKLSVVCNMPPSAVMVLDVVADAAYNKTGLTELNKKEQDVEFATKPSRESQVLKRYPVYKPSVEPTMDWERESAVFIERLHADIDLHELYVQARPILPQQWTKTIDEALEKRKSQNREEPEITPSFYGNKSLTDEKVAEALRAPAQVAPPSPPQTVENYTELVIEDLDYDPTCRWDDIPVAQETPAWSSKVKDLFGGTIREL